MLYSVILTNGLDYPIEADEVETRDGIYTFIFDGEVIAEFNSNRIAGYFVEDEEEDAQD